MLSFLFASLSYAGIGVIPQTDEAFEEYLLRVDTFLQQNKQILMVGNKQQEIQAVMPFEYFPAAHCKGETKGLLLSHGLSDSPYGMRSVAQRLSENCVHVRVILLPGHGTRAEDLIDVTREDWRQTFNRSALTFKGEVDSFFVGGFSTGGALALNFAVDHSDDVEGVVLFSPLLKINSGIDWLSPFLSPVLTWLDHEETDDYAKYASIPVPAIAEAYKTAKELRSRLHEKPLSSVPVFIALADQDATVDSAVTQSIFSKSLVNKKSQMLIYSSEMENQTQSRTRVINAYLPHQKITGLSHMSIHGSPKDPHYGSEGDYRICDFLSDEESFQRCKTEPSIWFGEKGELLSSKSAYGARITWNPYFNLLVEDIIQFIKSNS
ncbi:alpha/beta fold hydrolase [Marinomonas sp. 15G1-11]|uniref:Alpha/beta fold hydrolase n=1 Tax=Marinomonas phaeophyticola TaxID=3004091 RepID=A0ABT4JWE2_9GAMM|nr:alpha/beta fold hydrolase [Marinomonas sp. 15G1-11]MCZ2722531.1 alpha/beta fold hydrolase [Marinomonas sp. 15G1-11]